MLRRKPMPRVSPKQRVEMTAYEIVRQRAFDRDNGQCQARSTWPETGCWGRVEVHHRGPRSRYPELRLELSNLCSLCAGHHSAVHGDPVLAKERGLLL